MEKNLLKTRLISVLLSVALVVTLTPLGFSPFVEKEASAASSESGVFLYEADGSTGNVKITGVTPAGVTGPKTVVIPVTLPAVSGSGSSTVSAVTIIGSPTLAALSFAAGRESEQLESVVVTGNKNLTSFDATQAAIEKLELYDNNISVLLGLRQGLKYFDSSSNSAITSADAVTVTDAAFGSEGNKPEITGVQTVIMRNCGITLAGIMKLAGFVWLQSLVDIDLSNNEINSFDFGYLVSAESINLSNNKLGETVDGQTGWLKLTPASINVGGNDVTGGAVLKTLNLSGNVSLASITYGGVNGSLQLPALEKFIATNSAALPGGITSKFLEDLIKAGAVDVKKLKELDLSGNDLTWFDFNIFTGGAIEKVNLSGNTISSIILPTGDDGTLAALTEINLNGNTLLSGAALDFKNFVSLKALKTDGISNLKVTYPANYFPPSGGGGGGGGTSKLPVTVTLNAAGGKFSGTSPEVLVVTTYEGVTIADAIKAVATLAPKPEEYSDDNNDTLTHYVNITTTYALGGWYNIDAASQTGAKLTTISKDNANLYASWIPTVDRKELARATTKIITPAFSKFKAKKISFKGKLKKGTKLTAKYDKVKAQKGVKYGKPKFQWLQNGKIIKKATKSTFKLTSKQKGKKISVKITYKPTPNPKVADVPTKFGSRTVSVETTYELKKVPSSKSTKTSPRTGKVK